LLFELKLQVDVLLFLFISYFLEITSGCPFISYFFLFLVDVFLFPFISFRPFISSFISVES